MCVADCWLCGVCCAVTMICAFTNARLPYHSSTPAVIDLNEFGLGGAFPSQLAMSRDTVLGEAPSLFELVHQNDPFVKNFLQDPTSIYKTVQDAINGAGVQA